MSTYTFKMTHDEASVVVQVAGDASLHDFAETLLSSIGFELDHAFGFYSNLDRPAGSSANGGEHYTLFADMDDTFEDDLDGAGSVEKTPIRNVFHEGRKMLFFFDYGDAWSFIVDCIGVETGRTQSAAKVLSVQGTWPEQYGFCKGGGEVAEQGNIIRFPSHREKLPLFVYLPADCQKLFSLKPKDILRDSEHDLSSSTWLSTWRCAHIGSDSDDKHLFLFTHETTFFSIIVFQKGLNLDSCLSQFKEELLFRLKETISIPPHLSVDIEIMKGNPRSLITTMNQILFEASFELEDRFSSYEALEDNINNRYRSSSCFKSSEAFSEKLCSISSFSQS